MPAPPSTSITSTSAERSKSSTPSDTVEVVCASSAPAMPGDRRRHGVDLADMRADGAPIAGMRTEFSRMPRSASPNGELVSRRTIRKIRNSTDQRIDIGGVAPQIEFEHAEQLADADALQAVGAAGQPMRAVGGLEHQEAHAERDHDQRQMLEARDDEARGIAERCRPTARRRTGRGSDRHSRIW